MNKAIIYIECAKLTNFRDSDVQMGRTNGFFFSTYRRKVIWVSMRTSCTVLRFIIPLMISVLTKHFTQPTGNIGVKMPKYTHISLFYYANLQQYYILQYCKIKYLKIELNVLKSPFLTNLRRFYSSHETLLNFY